VSKKHPQPSSQQLIDSLPDPFVIIDANYTIVTANRAYADYYGVAPDSLCGRRCHEVSHHLDSPCSRHGEHCPLEEIFRTREAAQVIHVHCGPDGLDEKVQIDATPLLGADGQVEFMGERILPIRSLSTDDYRVGQSECMQLMIKQLLRVAPTRTTILLLGESGTGKEHLARYIHQHSNRRERPFVVFDCALAGADDIDRHLFGVLKKKGQESGVFTQADGGTLFIDEICELPAESQQRLLRVLECGEIQPVGASTWQQVDVRVIIASHHDLQKAVQDGDLRKDLYYRLSAFPVRLPPLRDRRQDIPELAAHFLEQFQPDPALRQMSEAFMDVLVTHDYPGNVRELRNLIERAVIYAADEPLRTEHLVFDDQLVALDADAPEAMPVDEATRHLVARRGGGPADIEILKVLKACNGHRGEAARRLGISERTLYRHLKRLRGG
jgi:DNA-binding NtrC family response regulator